MAYCRQLGDQGLLVDHRLLQSAGNGGSWVTETTGNKGTTGYWGPRATGRPWATGRSCGQLGDHRQCGTAGS